MARFGWGATPRSWQAYILIGISAQVQPVPSFLASRTPTTVERRKRRRRAGLVPRFLSFKICRLVYESEKCSVDSKRAVMGTANRLVRCKLVSCTHGGDTIAAQKTGCRLKSLDGDGQQRIVWGQCSLSPSSMGHPPARYRFFNNASLSFLLMEPSANGRSAQGWLKCPKNCIHAIVMSVPCAIKEICFSTDSV